MRLVFDRSGCRRGIYVIKNAVNGHWYVGQTVDIVHRFYSHRSEMRRRHSNQHLANAVAKYGIDAFEMSMMRPMPTGDLDIAEQFEIIRSWDGGRSCYNINPTAAKPPSAKGKSKSPEHKRKIGEAQRWRWREVVQIGPDGAEVGRFASAAEAGRQTGVSRSAIQTCCSGRPGTAGGFIWRYPGSPVPLPRERGPSGRLCLGKQWGVVLVSASGERVEVGLNGAEKARSLGLKKAGFYALVAGRTETYKGWHIDGRALPRWSARLRAPDGRIFEVGINRAAFCREHGLGYSGIRAVLEGRLRQAFGWTLETDETQVAA